MLVYLRQDEGLSLPPSDTGTSTTCSVPEVLGGGEGWGGVGGMLLLQQLLTLSLHTLLPSYYQDILGSNYCLHRQKGVKGSILYNDKGRCRQISEAALAQGACTGILR